jgi:hypothetical protein
MPRTLVQTAVERSEDGIVFKTGLILFEATRNILTIDFLFNVSMTEAMYYSPAAWPDCTR